MAFNSVKEAQEAAKKIKSNKDIRNFAREAINCLHITSFDLKRNDCNKIIISNKKSCHDWNGCIILHEPIYKQLKSVLNKFSNNEKLTLKESYILVELIHEELHGYSPCYFTALCNYNIKTKKWDLAYGPHYLEEISTELLSRIVVTYLDITNKETHVPYYKNNKWYNNKHKYLKYACNLAEWLSNLCGYNYNEAINQIILASISMRIYKFKTFTNEEYITLFGNYLGLNKTQSKMFLDRHINLQKIGKK